MQNSRKNYKFTHLVICVLLLSSSFGCKSSQERQDEVADDNILKNYVVEPKNKANAVKDAVEQRQKKLDF